MTFKYFTKNSNDTRKSHTNDPSLQSMHRNVNINNNTQDGQESLD